MNKSKKSVTKCSIQNRDKKIDNTEEVPVKKIMKGDIGNESPQYSSDSRVSGHSTPIQKKEHVFYVEDSPEIDYHYSPISLPCTQEGGNEIAWDWQTSAGKNSNDKAKPQSNLIETPKRTKQLQKKRNSNSPLLQKPLKRKQVKMENIENIGKLTAELKALSEKMKSMQKNCANHITAKDDTKCEHENIPLIKLNSENSSETMLQINTNNDESKINTITIDNMNKKDLSYKDLFDDSIDDSMVKCTQEVEEKLKLCKSNENGVMELFIVSEEKELFSTSEKETDYLTSSNTTESSKNSNITKSSSSVNTSGCLKTYSNNSSKVNFSSNVSVSNSKDISFRKPHFNNNVTSMQIRKQVLEKKDMSEFPDDSFDDCLATCMEDDKLLSNLSEYDFNVSNMDSNLNNFGKVSTEIISSKKCNKQVSNSLASRTVDITCNSKSSSHENTKLLITNDLAENNESINYKEGIQKSFAGNTALENRKFFKTKSLSDQYFYQSKYSYANSKTNKTISSSEKRFSSNSVSSSIRRKRPR
ncbi:uncharacterized protein LOC143145583 isoform X2 [Ptiloglossa arizonensis]|uniref:uncharacterized protein LOC143145583 isoform X2 n=1 Tax=Ptiloglossa arizonensis TaxID=3350558 RepID=UPI003FA09044